VFESITLMHRSRIARLDVPARAIFSSPAGFKHEALAKLQAVTQTNRLPSALLSDDSLPQTALQHADTESRSSQI